MSKMLNALKWGISRGKESQNFLGAKWIGSFLGKVSEKNRRIWALRILSLSPHYFLDREDPKYLGMSNDEYLNATFDSLIDSRENIYQKILRPYLSRKDVVLDYGCGPGLLARVTAPHVSKIYAMDISAGAIACARIVNPVENVEYIVADENGLSVITDAGLDIVYSFAVIQHLTNDIFEIVLKNCQAKLKPGGRLILHIQLTDDIWQSEDQYKADSSVHGKIKYELGLHCFGRTEQEHIDIVSRHNFVDIEIKKLEDFVPEFAHEVHSQRLLVARKAS